MGCEQSSLSSSARASQITVHGKKMSFFHEESKAKDPPSRPMSKMDSKPTFSSSANPSNPAPNTQSVQQQQQQQKQQYLVVDRKDSGKPQEISLFSLKTQEEVQNELSRTEQNDNESLLNKQEAEMPEYQISREQHKEIYYFVRENSRLIHVYSQRLNEHLVKNIDDNSSELPILMEYLKNSSKDVENCMDDLYVYPIDNEKAFYTELEQRRQLAKNIKAEYKKYNESACGYTSFREITLEILCKYNAIAEESLKGKHIKTDKAASSSNTATTALTQQTLNSPISEENNENEASNQNDEKKTGTETPSTDEEAPRSIGDMEQGDNAHNGQDSAEKEENRDREGDTEGNKESNEELEARRTECVDDREVVLNVDNEEKNEENQGENTKETQNKEEIVAESEKEVDAEQVGEGESGLND